MENFKDWLASSIDITQKSKDPYRSNFEFELKQRKKMLEGYEPSYYEVSIETTPGTYKIMGQNPDDPQSCYIGNVIIEYDDDTWLATWYISGFTHFAYGMQVSPNILVFNFSYVDEDDEPHTGLVAYTFFSSHIVHGEWMEEGFSEKGVEELRKLEEDDTDFNDSHDANLGFSLN